LGATSNALCQSEKRLPSRERRLGKKILKNEQEESGYQVSSLVNLNPLQTLKNKGEKEA